LDRNQLLDKVHHHRSLQILAKLPLIPGTLSKRGFCLWKPLSDNCQQVLPLSFWHLGYYPFENLHTCVCQEKAVCSDLNSLSVLEQENAPKASEQGPHHIMSHL
ncbi:hypothetical protein CFOL_v3_23162, partial [Cephalotus follicularis]